MKVVVQRVSSARGAGPGARGGAGARGRRGGGAAPRGHAEGTARALARKVANLRVFEDGAGKMNLDARQAGGAVLLVSQFTLLADASRGNRPSFTGAEAPELAEPLVRAFADAVRAEGLRCETGRFGAAMAVHLVNDGPVTIVLES